MSKANLNYVYRCTFVAAIGGLLFGYDTAVVAGAIGFLQQKYALSAGMMGWVASCALIGCIAGAMAAGYLSDSWGRKNVLLLSGFAFLISSVGILIPLDLLGFIVFRIIGGVGIGVASILAPLYISEIAPKEIRGRLVSIYQLGIVVGILLIYFVNAFIAGLYDEAWNVEFGWRYMFGSGLIPSLIFILLLYIVPESPRWLAKKNRWQQAERILQKINSPAQAAYELQEIQQSLQSVRKEPLSSLFKPGLRKALLIGVVLAILSQVTGINVIMYYAPEIFKSTGSGTASAFMQTILVGGINLVMTVFAIKYVDQLGRKKLLLIGSAGMTVCLALIGYAFYMDRLEGYWVLTGILAYISFFAFSLGPLTFVVVSEIFPNYIRGRAMSIAIFFLWVAVFAVSQTFPMLLESIGSAWTFWIYMSMSAVAFFFVWSSVPETKGKTLEEIERLWSVKETGLND